MSATFEMAKSLFALPLSPCGVYKQIALALEYFRTIWFYLLRL